MTIDDKIRDEKLQYDINIVLSNQGQIIEQTKFAYCPIGKAFEKQTKNN